MPKVSVIVPNYNHARFLKQRLQSIFAQTYRDFELIILDDKSKDNSVAEIKAIIQENKYSGIPVRLIVNDTNSGSPFKQWEKGILEAQGEYIWIAESDDYADVQLISSLMTKIDNEDLELCFCNSQIVDENGLFQGTYKSEDPFFSFYKQDHVFDFSDVASIFCLHNLIPNASSVVFSKKLAFPYLDKLVEYKYSGDWWFWIELVKSAKKCGYIKAPLNCFRRHSNAQTYSGDIRGHILEDLKAVCELKETSRPLNYKYWVDHWLKSNQYHLRDIISHYPNDFISAFYKINPMSLLYALNTFIMVRAKNLWIKISGSSSNK